jgi:hypothetical protein
MTADEDEWPLLGATRRTLGAVRNSDIPVAPDGTVSPQTGGMSVAPDAPSNLPVHRRPPEFGGTGLDPVFVLAEEFVGPDLIYRPDPNRPQRHGFIEPTRTMLFEQYQRALWATREAWDKVNAP